MATPPRRRAALNRPGGRASSWPSKTGTMDAFLRARTGRGAGGT